MAEYADRISNDDRRESELHHGKAGVVLVKVHAHPTSALGVSRDLWEPLDAFCGFTGFLLRMHSPQPCSSKMLLSDFGSEQGRRQRLSRKRATPFWIAHS